MSLKKEEPRAAEIPDVVFDPSTQKRYLKGRFLGKVCSCLERMRFNNNNNAFSCQKCVHKVFTRLRSNGKWLSTRLATWNSSRVANTAVYLPHRTVCTTENVIRDITVN